MDYSIHDAIEAGFNKIVFIIRKDIKDAFKEVIGDRISIIFPDQPFDPVCSPSTKKIKGIRFDRIFSQIRTYGICQTVNPGTKISITGNNKDLFKTSSII